MSTFFAATSIFAISAKWHFNFTFHLIPENPVSFSEQKSTNTWRSCDTQHGAVRPPNDQQIVTDGVDAVLGSSVRNDGNTWFGVPDDDTVSCDARHQNPVKSCHEYIFEQLNLFSKRENLVFTKKMVLISRSTCSCDHSVQSYQLTNIQNNYFPVSISGNADGRGRGNLKTFFIQKIFH